MSNAVFNRVRNAELKTPEKFVLMMLANMANDQGSTQKYASIARIMADCCMSRRTVTYALRALEDLKIIATVAKNGEIPTYFINPEFEPTANQSDQNSVENPFNIAESARGACVAPVQILQENVQNLHGGGAYIAGGGANIDVKTAISAPYTSTSYTSLTSSTSAQDAHAPESVKTDKPKKAKFDPLAIDLPANVNQKLWAEFVTMRKEIKKPVSTERAANGLINQLTRLPEPNASLQQSIDNCWQGVFAVKGGSAYTQPLPSPKPLPQSQTPREPVVSYIDQQTPLAERQAFAAELLAKLR